MDRNTAIPSISAEIKSTINPICASGLRIMYNAISEMRIVIPHVITADNTILHLDYSK